MSEKRTINGSVECRRHAIDVLDRLLAEHDPDHVQEGMVNATRCVVRYRDALIAECRAGSDAEKTQALRDANAVLSLMFGTQYPLEGVHWDRLSKARDALKALARDASPESGAALKAAAEPAHRITP
jgi:hypothetical protein